MTDKTKEVGSAKSQPNMSNSINDSKLYKADDEISTSINKTVECNEIISIIGDSKLALVSRNYSGAKWRTSICEPGMGGNWMNKNTPIESTKALWEEDKPRNASIKKLFGKYNLCSETSAKEKGILLENIIDSISEEDKLDCIDFKSSDNLMPKNFKYVEGVTYKKFISKYKENYQIDDESTVVVTLATMLSNMRKNGDPVWLLIVAPPSGGKTELIRMLTDKANPNKFAHPISFLTPNTFVSGMEGNDDLLPRLNGKILALKDFTTILSMPTDASNAIMGQLREIYDGYYSKDTGNAIASKKYTIKTTIISGVTPTIDKYTTIQAAMGERFIRIRQHADVGNEEADIRRRAMTDKAAELDMSKENPVREELSNFILSLLTDFDKETDEYKPKIDSASLIAIKNCADITAALRTGFDRDYRGDIEREAESEYSPRLVKTYIKLAESIAWLLGKEKVDMECISYIYRVSLDSLDKKRVTIMKHLSKETQTTSQIAAKMKLSNRVTSDALDELWMLDIISKTKKDERKRSKKSKKDEEDNTRIPWIWSYNEESPIIKYISFTEEILRKIGGINTHHYNISTELTRK